MGPEKQPGKEANPQPVKEIPAETAVTTQHRLMVDGRPLAYSATASTMHVTSSTDAPKAALFSVAYTLDGVTDPGTRPVTFCFNGGPGSSSVWLHMGALGPVRVDLPDAVAPKPPPYSVVDNPEGLLDVTDLVFIDPVGTGLSQPVGKGKRADFTQVKGDVTSVGEFIERWITRNGRWNSPKFLAGESYGTTRAAGLADHLTERGIMCNGLLLFSVAFDFQTFVTTRNNDLPHVLMLPAYTATAAYHGKVAAPDLEALLEAARTFALGPYATALLHGVGTDAAQTKAVAQRLEALTSIAASEWIRHDLRIDQSTFCAKLMEAERLLVGRLDSRYLGRSPQVAASSAAVDPSYHGPLAPFAAALNDHLRRTLEWTDEAPYEVISTEVNEGWTIERDWWAGFVDVSGRLRTAMLANPHLKLFVANGVFDLATPFAGTEYSVAHLGTEPEIGAAVTMHAYEAGHMMYLHAPSRAQMRADLVAFYAAALG